MAGELNGLLRLEGDRAVLWLEILAVLDYQGRVAANSHACPDRLPGSTKNCISVFSTGAVSTCRITPTFCKTLPN